MVLIFRIITGLLLVGSIPRAHAQAHTTRQRVVSTQAGTPFLVEERGVPCYNSGLARVSVNIPADRIVASFKDYSLLSLPDSATRLLLQARVLATPSDPFLIPYYYLEIPSSGRAFYLRYSVYAVQDLIQIFAKNNVFSLGYWHADRADSLIQKHFGKHRMLPDSALQDGVSMGYQQYGATAADKVNDEALGGVTIDEEKRLLYRNNERMGYFAFDFKNSVQDRPQLALYKNDNSLLMVINTPELRASNFLTLYPEKEVVEILLPEKDPLVWVRIGVAWLIKNSRL